VSHPRAVEVKAVDGLIILTGPIFTREEHPLIESVTGIRGVKNIKNQLELHEKADDIPALQGGRTRQGPAFGPLKTNWSPTTRLVATATGGALTLYGARRRGVVGSAISSAGLALVIRALTNFETGRLLGLNGQRNETGAHPHDAAKHLHAETTAAIM
jgi:hypothetical protein